MKPAFLNKALLVPDIDLLPLQLYVYLCEYSSNFFLPLLIHSLNKYLPNPLLYCKHYFIEGVTKCKEMNKQYNVKR